MATNTGLAALFDPSYQTGDPELDALFGLTGQQEEELPPLRYPERREIPRGEAPVRGEAPLPIKIGKGGKGTENLKSAYQYFVSQGFAPHQAAAIVGNLAQESAGRTTAVGGNVLPNDPHSVGLGQWNRERLYGGKGYVGLIPFAKQRGSSPEDLQTQLDYVMQELRGPERAAYNSLMQAGSLEEATRVFGKAYERPREKYADYGNRIAQAKKYIGAEGAETPDLTLSQTPQALQRSQLASNKDSPYYPVRLSDGQVFDVEKGMGLDEVAAMLQQNKINAKPLRPYVTPDGQEFDVEYDMTDDEIQSMLKGQKPATPEDSNYLGAIKHGAQQGAYGIMQGAGTEIEELGKAAEGASWLGEYGKPVGEFLRGKGEQLHAYGEQRSKDIEGTYERPKGLGWVEENVTYPLAETVGGVAPYAGAFMVPGVGPALGTAAVHAGSMGELESRAEAQGKEFVPSEARPYAVLDDVANMIGLGATNKLLKAFGQDAILGSREAIKAAVEKGGIEEARKVVGSRIGNIAKQVGIAEIGTIGGEVAEDVIGRAYTDQPLIGDDAFREYWETTKQMAPLGGVTGMGRGLAEHYNKNIEVARLEEQAGVEQALQEQEAQRQKIEELATIGVTPEQLQKYGLRNELEGLSDEELLEKFKADTAEKEAAKAARLAELPEELRDIPYREAKRYQEMLAEQEAGVLNEEPIEPVEEPAAPVEPVDITPPPAPEMGAPAVQEAPEVKAVEETQLPTAPTHFSDTLGIASKSGKKIDIPLRKALAQLDIENPQHQPVIAQALEEGIKLAEKGQIQLDVPKAQEIINFIKPVEVPSADIQPTPEKFNVSSIAQPEIRQEGQGAQVSSQGVRSSGQEVGAVKTPEIQEVETVEAPKLEIPKAPQAEVTLPPATQKAPEIPPPAKEVEAPVSVKKPKDVLAERITAVQDTLREVNGLIKTEQAKPKPNPALLSQYETRQRTAEQVFGNLKKQLSQLLQTQDAQRRAEAEQTAEIARAEAARKVQEQGGFEEDLIAAEKVAKRAARVEAPTLAKPVKEKIKEVPTEEDLIKRIEEMQGKKGVIKEAKASNPDVGIRPVKVEDYSDVKDTRELAKRYKEKGTDPELLKLMDTINVSPHLGSLPVEWVQKGDKPHSDVVDAFNKGATAMVAWGDKTGPKMYIRADAPLREDILVHEAVHGVTEAALQRNPESAKELSDLSKQIGYSLSEEHRMAHGSKGKEASDFWNEVIKDNPGELLAYGLTSPTFREVLSQYGADGKPFKAYRTEAELNALRKGQEKPERVFKGQAPKELTLWDKFVDAVAKLFGLPTSRKAEFKRQLEEYLDKKATYEQMVKDYNTLRPLQERLDTVFKEALRETSKKGIDFEGTAVKEVKGPSEAELKEAEKRLKASGLVGSVKEKTFTDKFKGAINDLFKEGRNNSFVSEYVDIREPISKAVQNLPDNVGKKLRSDYIYSAYEQRGNVIQESYRKGFVAMGRDGTLETVADKQLALAEIFKRVGVKNHSLFNNVLVALRVRTIRAQDAETRAQANKLLNMADEMEDFASSLKDTAKRKKFNSAARNLRTVAERKLEGINWDKGRTAFTEQEVKDAETVIAAHPEVAREAENVYALLRKQVDLWENEGMVDSDTAKQWREYPNYFPLYKVEKYDEELTNPAAHIDNYAGMMGKGPKQLPKVHAQEWHEHQVFVEDNLLRHITFFASAAAEHSARKNTAYNLEMVGKAERVKKDNWGKKDLIVKFRENGKDVFYRIDDAPSYFAMQSAMPLMSPLLKRMRQAGNFGRGVMIKNPLFWFRQAIREPIQASLVGRAGMISPFDTLNAVSRIASGSAKGYERLRAKGVIGPVDVIPDPAEFIKSVQNGKGLIDKGMDGINHVHEAMDAATRVVVYEKAKKDALSKGFDEDTADAIGVMKAREIINFAKQGRSKTVRAIRATTPFFGAALNSLDVMARAAFPRTVGHLSKVEAMEARRNFYSTAFMLAAFSTSYAAMMSEDEDYLKEPDRVGNWLIPIGGGKFIKIPIPFEAGWFTKELPELAMLLNMGAINIKEAITEGKKGFTANVLPPMPTAYVLQPIMEVAVDHDFFTGSSIEGKDSDVMVRDRNSKASKLMTEVVNKMEDMGVNVLGVSANQLEHLARKYLGQVWALTRTASDAYINRGKVTPKKEAGEYPLVSGVVTTGTKDRAVNEFYTVAKEVSQVNQSLQEAGKKGDAERFNQIVSNPENVKALQASDEMKKLKEEIGELSTGIKRIENDQSLSSSEMTSRIKMLKARQTLLAKRGVEVARKLGLDI